MKKDTSGAGGGAADGSAAGGASGADAGGSADAADTGSPSDVATSACDPAAPFGAPAPVASLNSPQNESNLSLSADGLTVYLSSTRTGTMGGYDIWMATRSSASDPFATPVAVGGVNGVADDVDPRISADGLRLYMRSNRAPATGTDIMLATRTSILVNFGAPAAITGINTTSSDEQPFLISDEKIMFFQSNRPGGSGGLDIYTASVGTGGTFGTPQAVAALNTAAADAAPVLTPDGLTIFYATQSPDTGYDVMVAHRSTLNDGFGTPQKVTELDGTTDEYPVEISHDGCTIYISTNRSGGAGGYDLYSARRGH
jgi:Tol biopolymer transport system component